MPRCLVWTPHCEDAPPRNDTRNRRRCRPPRKSSVLAGTTMKGGYWIQGNRTERVCRTARIRARENLDTDGGSGPMRPGRKSVDDARSWTPGAPCSNPGDRVDFGWRIAEKEGRSFGPGRG